MCLLALVHVHAGVCVFVLCMCFGSVSSVLTFQGHHVSHQFYIWLPLHIPGRTSNGPPGACAAKEQSLMRSRGSLTCGLNSPSFAVSHSLCDNPSLGLSLPPLFPLANFTPPQSHQQKAHKESNTKAKQASSPNQKRSSNPPSHPVLKPHLTPTPIFTP